MAKKSSGKRKESRSKEPPGPVAAPAVGDIVVLEVEEFAPTGDAVAKLGGYVVFVRDALPGEKIRAKMTVAKPRYGRAEIVEMLTPAPNRIAAKCRHFGECGRCAFQHLPYADQLRLKTEMLRDAVSRALPNRPITILPMRGEAEPWGLRTKAHFVFAMHEGQPVLGHFRPHSTSVLPIVECPVHHPSANAAAWAVLDAVRRHRLPVHDEASQKGSARHVVVRASLATGDASAMLVTAGDRIDHIGKFGPRVMESAPAVVGVHRLVNREQGPIVVVGHPETLHGSERLIETIAGVDFHLSPTTFFQTNASAAKLLVELVLDAIPLEARRVLDLYCGAGLFSLPLAKRGSRVVGVESSRNAVADAVFSAEKASLMDRCEFHAMKVEHALESGKRLGPVGRQGTFDAVILDPPREGCPPELIAELAREVRPPIVVSVSCDPAALARELVVWTDHDYRVRFIQPVDMFPHTAQIEALAVLDRGTSRPPAPPQDGGRGLQSTQRPLRPQRPRNKRDQR